MGRLPRVLHGVLLALALLTSGAIAAELEAPAKKPGLYLRKAAPEPVPEPAPRDETPAPLESLFPELSGRVVDGAGMLGSTSIRYLTPLLAAHEQRTGDQVVVVTLDSLRGNSIEAFGVQLGRHWGLGQRGLNNGVLLIVARAERKMRIEVGYGLEGLLTDALASQIIAGMGQDFARGEFAQGIINGTQAILDTLGRPAMARVETYQEQLKSERREDFFLFGLLAVVLGLLFLLLRQVVDIEFVRGKYQPGVSRRSSNSSSRDSASASTGSYEGSSGSAGSSDSGDSLRSGGGSFGGGGASGSW